MVIHPRPYAFRICIGCGIESKICTNIFELKGSVWLYTPDKVAPAVFVSLFILSGIWYFHQNLYVLLS